VTKPGRVVTFDAGRHQTDRFDCGRPALDRWLRAYAGQSQRRDVARTFVATDRAQRVLGYYTLVAAQVEHASAPAVVRAGASAHFPIPVCLIARLAVCRHVQGQGLGGDLLVDALRRALAASEEIGIRAILVHAIDEEAARFYRQFDFEPATRDGLTLLVPLVSVRTQLRGG